MNKHTFSRRRFLASTALVGTALVAAPMVWAAPAGNERQQQGATKMKTRKLGGLEVSELVLVP